MSAARLAADEASETRRRVDALVSRMPQSDSADRAFDKPWQLRAFAIAVAAYHEGHYEWSEFQLSLAESIRTWEEGGHEVPWNYYEHWLEALEKVLGAHGLGAEMAEVDQRTRSVLATPSNANHHEAHWEPIAISPGRTAS